MTKTITLHGKTLNLEGNTIKLNDKMPNFTVSDKDFNEVSFYKFKENSVCLISCVPSLDTDICALQTKKFNETLKTEFKDQIKACTISMDLPFAQNRFCDSGNINNIDMFSDHKYHSFADQCGLLIKELGLIARAVIIIDKENIVKYIEISEEVSNEPDYTKALNALKEEI